MPILQTRLGSSGGGGDATAANQNLQIGYAINTVAQLADNTTGTQSVFKSSNLESVFQLANTTSVFKDTANNSVFQDQTGLSVFRDSFDISTFNSSANKSILKQTKESNNATSVISFQNTTPITLATDIQNWLQSNNVIIMQIVYADAGGIAPNPHTALIIYNVI